jgi:hypothetical protein
MTHVTNQLFSWNVKRTLDLYVKSKLTKIPGIWDSYYRTNRRKADFCPATSTDDSFYPEDGRSFLGNAGKYIAG